jgi:UDP-N-acetylglucosamine diphosphorylase/glucosamine-1-phosphate N-acetyltransferase
MPSRILIFEDAGAANLRPLVWTRPAWELRSGMATLGEKIAAAYAPAEVFFHARPHLAEVIAQDSTDRLITRPTDAKKLAGAGLLAVNARVLADATLAGKIPLEGRPQVFRSGDTIVAVRLADGEAAAAALAGDYFDAAALAVIANNAGGTVNQDGAVQPGRTAADFEAAALAATDVELALIRWPWDLVNANAAQIEADFHRFAAAGGIKGTVHPSAILDGEDRMHIAPGSKIGPGAILTTEHGPIYIGPGAEVQAGAVIEGPAAIGADSRVRMLAKIYGGTTLGPLCRVGGEIEQSILHAYVNKQHDGFLGHSYLAPWCNLGADTNTSDLKNNYAYVRVSLEGREVNTGCLNVGLFMGDHSKSGINTMFNTGSVVGVGCNVFGGDFPPKDIPSFTWGGAAGLMEHDFEKFCDTAERAMARREKQFTPAMRAMLEHVFHQTRGWRRTVLKPDESR